MIQYLNRADPSLLRGIALLRLDFNTDNEWRMKAGLKTVRFLLRRSDKVIILSHRGRPGRVRIVGGRPSGFDQKLSLKQDALRLQKFLGRKVSFIPHFRFDDIKKQIASSPKGSIFVLENLRFLKGEEENSQPLAKKLATLGNYYINDALAVSHRKNASVCAITRYLPSYVGLELQKEIEILRRVMRKFKRPLVIVLGGAKVTDKIGVIRYFWRKTDYFLLGGGPANTFLAARGLPIGKSLVDPKAFSFAREFASTPKIVLPIDFKISAGKILDIGPRTRERYAEIIKKSRTVIWNGPMGFFEHEEFSEGTKSVWQAILRNRKAKIVIGGGETIASLRSVICGLMQNERRLAQKLFRESQRAVSVSPRVWISTGGGAMLQFLAGKKLPGIKALESRKQKVESRK